MPMFFKLICKNIKHYKYRFVFIFLITLMVNFVVLTGHTFVNEMQAGINEARNRLGADLVLLPKTAENVDAESVLFHGTPSTLVMDDITSEIAKLKTVDVCAGRLYLASLSGQSCCDGSVQLIATDISKDFLLSPYMDTKELNDNEIVLGHKFNANPGDTVKYFGRTFTVKEVLTKSNTGIDESGFITLSMAKEIINDPMYKDKYFSAFSDNSTSMIFIRTSDAKLTNNVIKSVYGNKVSIYVPDKKIADYTKSMGILSNTVKLMNAALVIVGVFAILCITLISTETRRNEYGSLILLGFKPVCCYLNFVTEYVIISVIASACATIMHFIANAMWIDQISQALSIPVLNVNAVPAILATAIITMIINALASAISLIKISMTSPSVLIKEAS